MKELSPKAQALIERAAGIAWLYDSRIVNTEHLILAMIAMEDDVPLAALKSMGVDPVSLRYDLTSGWPEMKSSADKKPEFDVLDVRYDQSGRFAVTKAHVMAHKLNHDVVESADILLGVVSVVHCPVSQLLAGHYNIDEPRALNQVLRLLDPMGK